MYLDYNGTYHFIRLGQGTASGIYIDVTVYNSSNWTVTVKKACKAYHINNETSGTATVPYTSYNVGDSFRIGSGYNLNYFTEP